MTTDALRDELLERLMRFGRIDVALKQLEEEKGLWLAGEWSPLLMAALVLLVDIAGDSWVSAHPWISVAPQPPLHCAGFRTEDMRRYRQLITVECSDRVVHLYPEDATHIAVAVRRAMAQELGY